MRKILVVIALALLATGAAAYWQRTAISDWASGLAREQAAPPAVSYNQISNTPSVEPEPEPTSGNAAPTEPVNTPTPAPAPTPSGTEPISFNLAVPFTSQAPTGDWDEPYQDACEEASLYMVHEYYEGVPAGQIDANTANEAILQIIKFEQALFGFYESTTAAQTAMLAEQMYGYEQVEVFDNPTVEDIKAQIAAGHPVIVPEDGQLLGNPYYTAPGPLYHMLVLKGYTKTQFITNDAGTRRGEDYAYAFDTVMNAMHDWNGGDVPNGGKEMIVVFPH